MEKYYKILDINTNATEQDVKQAYRDLVKVWHPDRFTHDPKLRKKAEEKLKEINEAYQKITDYLNNAYKHEQSYQYQKTEKQTTQSAQKQHYNENKTQYDLMRINKKLFYGMVILIVIVVSAIIIKFLLVSEKSGILKVINEGKAAIEAENIEKSMSYVSLQYSDDYGLKYLIVKRILADVFKEFDGFKVLLDNIEIDVNKKENTAVAAFDLRIIVTLHNQPGYLVGLTDSPAKIKMYFIKERLRWQVVKVSGIKMPHL